MPDINKQSNIKHILISRIDAIGDVVLTLPVCGYLKASFPHIKISFLGRTYTQPVINACASADNFINYDELKLLTPQQQAASLQKENIDAIVHVFPNKKIALLAMRAGIKTRIGTTNRVYHWLTCNKLVKLSRKKSDLHESQLNLVLLGPLGLKKICPLADIPQYYNYKPLNTLPDHLAEYLSNAKFNLILHPKSHGSAMEWDINSFTALIAQLPPDRFNIIITGSDKEKQLIGPWIKTLPTHVNDLTGKMSLTELMAFIYAADGLLAASTGPLHLAAASGIHALGLYSGLRPINASRWAPVGKKAEYLESASGDLNDIPVALVAEKINSWHK
jgi:heptosyltransferase III